MINVYKRIKQYQSLTQNLFNIILKLDYLLYTSCLLVMS